MRPELRVLLCCGYARDAFDDALSKARWPLLRKPYTKDELAAMLEAQMASAPT